MTPQQHYMEAERWLDLADEMMTTTNGKLLYEHAPHPGAMQRFDARDRCVREAQVHATLATCGQRLDAR